MTKNINFTGGFGEYFLVSLGLLILSALTVGIAFPYYIYWSFKYFFTRLEIDNKKVIFTGGFVEYFFISLVLLFLSVITLGIASPYWVYWSFKYFFANLEVEE